ncbi:FKBP-type peptidyl-prolyl cis-trans isomerase [Pseudomonadota bacterium]
MHISKYRQGFLVAMLLSAVFLLTGCFAIGTSPDGVSLFALKENAARKLSVDINQLVIDSSGLEWIVRKEGKGDKPKKGEGIVANYTGYLLENGKKFDSSYDRDRPFVEAIGMGKVIKGWDIAFLGMRAGERRVLFIPPELAYGERGAGQKIPPNATLVFDVELIRIIK